MQMRQYILNKVYAARRAGYPVTLSEKDRFVGFSHQDTKFLGLWAVWRKSKARRLAPSFFWEEWRWETLGEKITRLNQLRNKDSGVSRVRGRYRARTYAGGHEQHWGMFATMEEAMAAVRRGKKVK